MKWIAALSLVMNVVLGVCLLKSRDSQPPAAEPRPAPVPMSVQRVPPSVPPAPPEAARTNFHWSQVESADYLAYIANLRRIGCPETTIRDIIVADVNQLFAPRYAALGTNAPELSWWGRFDQRKPVRAELAAHFRALDAEKQAILERLLGPQAAAAVGSVETSPANVREESALAFLPEAKLPAVREVLKRYEALWEWSATQWKGLPSDEVDAKEKSLQDARQAELAALLSPEELREFALRDSPAANAVREQYGRAGLAEAEFRATYEMRRDFEQRHPEPRAEDWKRLEADYAAALGPERYGQIQRENDSMWRALQGLATEHGIQPDTMRQAHTLKQEYTDKLGQAVGAMFADPQRNPQPLRDLAAEMDARLSALLGPETVKQLDRAGVLPRLVIQDDGHRKRYSLSRGAFNE
jgi:hypothetical protein